MAERGRARGRAPRRRAERPRSCHPGQAEPRSSAERASGIGRSCLRCCRARGRLKLRGRAGSFARRAGGFARRTRAAGVRVRRSRAGGVEASASRERARRARRRGRASRGAGRAPRLLPLREARRTARPRPRARSRLSPREQRDARGRRRHQDAALVVGIAPPRHEALLLEIHDEATDGGRLELELEGQLELAQVTTRHDALHDLEDRQRHAEGIELDANGVRHAPADLLDEVREPICGLLSPGHQIMIEASLC